MDAQHQPHRAAKPRPRPVARELHRSLEVREMSAADLLQSLDDLGWSHDPKHLREVLGGKVLPSLGYLSEIMAALARRGQALRPSELSYWTGAMYEENEIIPARFMAAGEHMGMARIRRPSPPPQSGRTGPNEQSVQRDRDDDESAGEEGFEPSIA